MTLDDIRPFIRGASQFVWQWENRDFSMPYDCRIFSIRSGEAYLRTKSGEYSLRKGAVMFFNAAEPYLFRRADAETPFRLIVINLDLTNARCDVDSFIQPDTQKNFNPSRILERLDIPELEQPIIIPDESELSDKVYEIYKEHLGNLPYSSARMSALATEIIVSAVRLSRVGSSRRSKVVAAIKSFIHEHYGENITNIKIAAELGYHPYYLSRIFNEDAGISLHKYLIEYRLKTALHLLTVTSEPIEYISETCGFSSPAHFTASFKSKYNSPPSSYRRNGGDGGTGDTRLF